MLHREIELGNTVVTQMVTTLVQMGSGRVSHVLPGKHPAKRAWILSWHRLIQSMKWKY